MIGKLQSLFLWSALAISVCVGFSVAVFVDKAHASTTNEIQCERGAISGFITSWTERDLKHYMPRVFTFPPPYFEGYIDEGGGKVEFTTFTEGVLTTMQKHNSVSWTFFENGRLIGRAGPYIARYKCSGGITAYHKFLANKNSHQDINLDQGPTSLTTLTVTPTTTDTLSATTIAVSEPTMTRALNKADGETVKCKIISKVTGGGAKDMGKKALEHALLPDTLRFHVRDIEEKIDGKLFWKNYRYLPNGKLVLANSFDNHRELNKGARVSYACDHTAEEILAEKARLEKASTKATQIQMSALGTGQEGIASKEMEPQKQQTPSDIQTPQIVITSIISSGLRGEIRGRVTGAGGVAEVRVDGEPTALAGNGEFFASMYVPEGGLNVTVEAVDIAGVSSSMSVRMERATSDEEVSISFSRLNPLGRNVSQNPNALALIVGVDSYAKTPARAIYADSDARVFKDYATQKLGISSDRIQVLVNDAADEAGLLLSVKNWLTRAVIQHQTDVYIFFAGHGLASDDGKNMYLLPYDGAPELLDDTAIARERLFADIAAANPRSVTVFLDTCYSGTTRGTDMLIASRPIAIRAKEQAIPEGFTVMTAAAGDQTAKPLEEAKHGMFSYFLMKGMEGDADTNQDNQITAGELHTYVHQNVIQQSSGSQTPELQGDANRVLVRFQ